MRMGRAVMVSAVNVFRCYCISSIEVSSMQLQVVVIHKFSRFTFQTFTIQIYTIVNLEDLIVLIFVTQSFLFSLQLISPVLVMVVVPAPVQSLMECSSASVPLALF